MAPIISRNARNTSRNTRNVVLLSVLVVVAYKFATTGAGFGAFSMDMSTSSAAPPTKTANCFAPILRPIVEAWDSSLGETVGIAFTTVTIDMEHKDHALWVVNWYKQLQSVGILNPIVFGIDETGETCRLLSSHHIPCRSYDPQDFKFTKPPPLVHKRDGERPAAVDFKFAYAHELLSCGYQVNFSDDDVYWFKNPFAEIFEEDMRGLTDDTSGEDQLDGWTSSSCGLKYGSPCMSTGLWTVHPTPWTLAFFRGMIEDIKSSEMWEQEMMNVHLKQSWANKELSFRLFPKSTHANVFVWDQRNSAGLPLELTATHLGYVHGINKLKEYKKRGLWSPNFT